MTNKVNEGASVIVFRDKGEELGHYPTEEVLSL